MKKFSLRAFLVLAAMVGILMMTAAPASAAIAKGDSRVTSARLNMRAKASTSASVVTVIPKGVFVKITAVGSSNWYKVTYNKKSGYVSGDYLKDPFDLFGDKYSKYLSTAIWMRSSPNQSSTTNKMRIIPTGAKVFVIAKVANVNWYKIYYGGKIGYIIGGYFQGDTTNTRVLAKNVYLRSSPVISSGNKICVVPAGTRVVLLSKYNSQWYKVRYGTKVGYLSAGYFTTDSNNNNNSSSSSSTKTMSTSINMRKTRSTTADNVIAVIPEGAKVTVRASYSGNWYKVTYNGKTGYIKGGYFA